MAGKHSDFLMQHTQTLQDMRLDNKKTNKKETETIHIKIYKTEKNTNIQENKDKNIYDIVKDKSINQKL